MILLLVSIALVLPSIVQESASLERKERGHAGLLHCAFSRPSKRREILPLRPSSTGKGMGWVDKRFQV